MSIEKGPSSEELVKQSTSNNNQDLIKALGKDLNTIMNNAIKEKGDKGETQDFINKENDAINEIKVKIKKNSDLVSVCLRCLEKINIPSLVLKQLTDYERMQGETNENIKNLMFISYYYKNSKGKYLFLPSEIMFDYDAYKSIEELDGEGKEMSIKFLLCGFSGQDALQEGIDYNDILSEPNDDIKKLYMAYLSHENIQPSWAFALGGDFSEIASWGKDSVEVAVEELKISGNSDMAYNKAYENKENKD